MHRVLEFTAALSIVALVSLPASARQSPTDQSGSQPGSSSGSGGATGTSGEETSGASYSSDSSTKKAADDRAFAAKAAAGGLAEVKLGQLAADKASSDDVKKFGQMMVDDHSKANDQLKDIAQQKNITLPEKLNSEDQKVFDRLSKLSGAEFDRAYIKDMVSDHQKDVREFKHAASSLSDPELKEFASSTLPTLEKHLQDARQVQQHLNGAAGTSGTKDTRGTTGNEHPPSSAPTTPPRR
jgi:putative membrane protein